MDEHKQVSSLSNCNSDSGIRCLERFCIVYSVLGNVPTSKLAESIGYFSVKLLGLLLDLQWEPSLIKVCTHHGNKKFLSDNSSSLQPIWITQTLQSLGVH